jgi:hypothetical protein
VQDQAGVAESAAHAAVQLDVIRAVDAIAAAGVPVVARGTRGGAIHSISDDRLGADRDVGIVGGRGELIAADLDDKRKVGVWAAHRVEVSVATVRKRRGGDDDICSPLEM